MRKRGSHQGHEENGVLWKTLRKEPPTYAQSPANYKPKPIKIPFAKSFFSRIQSEQANEACSAFIYRQAEKLYPAPLPAKSSFRRTVKPRRRFEVYQLLEELLSRRHINGLWKVRVKYWYKISSQLRDSTGVTSSPMELDTGCLEDSSVKDWNKTRIYATILKLTFALFELC